MPDYEELVSFIVRNIVSDPDGVTVTSQKSSGGVVRVMIKVSPDDMGRLIGRHGVTINAIRVVARAAAVKPGEKVEVDILED
ncbi:MAG TPA: KH domain-containing protein [Synergistales bacterium]|nr:KH domain-containing protein [Synergistales bacterium]